MPTERHSRIRTRTEQRIRDDTLTIKVLDSRDIDQIGAKRTKRNIRHNTILMTRSEINSTFSQILPQCPDSENEQFILLCETHFLRLHHTLRTIETDCDC